MEALLRASHAPTAFRTKVLVCTPLNGGNGTPSRQAARPGALGASSSPQSALPSNSSALALALALGCFPVTQYLWCKCPCCGFRYRFYECALQTGGGGGSYASELAYVPSSWFGAGLSSSRYPPHPHPTQQQTSGWPTAHPVLGLLGKGAPMIPGQ